MSSLPETRPAFIEPMKALLARDLPRGPARLYELKFDGVRAIAIKDGSKVSLLSRAAKDLGNKYPEILESLKNLPARMTVLDGEVVALDKQSRPSFQALQTYHLTRPRPPLLYYVFDALNFDGKDLSSLPLESRRGIAQQLITALCPRLKMSTTIDVSRTNLLRQMQANGLEGLVAKLKNSAYEPGGRSGAWIKFKWSNEQEFVIGGYTQPKGGRTHFGALLVGYFETSRLIFVGKVGTGFDQRMLRSLHAKFQPLTIPECPFTNLPETILGPGKGLTRGQMRGCTWLKPKIVCQIRFAEWTRDNHLRQPAFLGLREDKDANEVVKEG